MTTIDALDTAAAVDHTAADFETTITEDRGDIRVIEETLDTEYDAITTVTAPDDLSDLTDDSDLIETTIDLDVDLDDDAEAAAGEPTASPIDVAEETLRSEPDAVTDPAEPEDLAERTDLVETAVDLHTAPETITPDAPATPEPATPEPGVAEPTHDADVSPALAEAIALKSHTAGEMVDDETDVVRLRRPSGFFGTMRNWLLALAMLAVSVGYVYWLVTSGPPLASRVLHAASFAAAAVIVITMVIDISRLALVSMLAMSTSLVRSPIPARIHQNLRIAVFITFVPRSESIEVLEKTLTAAKRLESAAGSRATADDPAPLVDVFVLDEGDPDHPTAVQDLIDRLNADQSGNTIRRISRMGVEKYNRGKRFAPKTKHGNFNAAYDVVKNSDDLPDYDVLVGIDPDHVPLPELTTRLTCYFNDPDVAYVSAPQAYGNAVDRTVPKLAESQQFVFHSLIQSAANSYSGAMLVGTNYAIRTSVYDQIGGAQPSITEDLATGLKALTKRNPETGREWKAVYTPDVLAHGEGPVTWGDYFKQQNRWATGAIRHVIAGPFFWQMMQMWRHPRRVLHYTLLMAFYPVMGLTWVLGAVNSGLFAWYGDSGTVVSPQHWILFYTWTIVLQVLCIISARRYNVSPYETTNSWGVFGMFMSVAAAPVYAASVIKSLLTANPKFEVTPKGKTSGRDSLFTFRHNLLWIAVYVAIVWMIFDRDRAAVETLAWPVIAGLLAVAPILIWLASRVVHWAQRKRTA